MPHNGLADPKARKYPGNQGGAGWDCDDGSQTTFTASTVTRSNITSLSEWAVGNNVNPNTVAFQTFRVQTGVAPLSEGGAMLLLGLAALAVVLGSVAWHRRCRS